MKLSKIKKIGFFAVILGMVLWVYRNETHNSNMNFMGQPHAELNQNSISNTVHIQKQDPILDKDIQLEVERFASQKQDDLVEETLPHGGVSVHLKGRFMNVPVAKREKNGNIIIYERSVSQE